MPKEFSHTLLAEVLLSRLRPGGPTSPAEALTRHSWAYYAGSISPDTLYYDFPDPSCLWLPHSAVAVARLLHRARGPSLYSVPLALLSELRWSGEPSLPHLAFALGFLCHLAVDMTFHPIVVRFAAERSAATGRDRAEHFRLESVLDELLYRRFGRSLAQTDLRLATRACSAQGADLARFYARGLAALDPGSDGELYYALKRAFCKQLWLNRLFQLPAFFRWSRRLSRGFPRIFETYHALAHPHLEDGQEGAVAGDPWDWAVHCWGSVPLGEVIETCLLRAEFLVRVGSSYSAGRLSRGEAEEAFLEVTPTTGVRGVALARQERGARNGNRGTKRAKRRAQSVGASFACDEDRR